MQNSRVKRKNIVAMKKNKKMSRVSLIHRRRVIAIRSAIVFVCLLFGTQIVHAKIADVEAKSDIKVSTEKLAKQKKENDSLNTQVKELKNKDYMKKYVRAKYYYSKSDEQVYAIPNGNE